MKLLERYGTVALGLVVALAVAEIAVVLAGPRLPEPSDWPTPESHLKSQQLASVTDELDVVFLGTSITEAALDPAVVADTSGFTVYNSAMPFMTPASMAAWYEEVVRPNLKPGLIVVGLPTWPFTSDTDEFAAGIRQATRPAPIERAAPWSRLVAHRGVLADWDRLAARERLLSDGTIGEDGHQTGYYDKEREHFDGLDGVGEGDSMSASQEAALERLVSEAEADGGAVVLLIEPSSQPETPARMRYQEWIEERARRWDVAVWNTYRMSWEDGWFADEVHFNRRGTVAFSRVMSELLEQRDSAD